MKQFLVGVVLTVVAMISLSPAAQAANTDNFTISKFDAEYTLGRDSENRSTLQASWRITANFPPNQNRGIAPIFVKEYDGHSTNFELKSVTDENGNQLNYNWNGDELRIGDKDVYVEGEKTYVIQFSQRDVTKHYADTGKDEFYWDVIGAEWRVPIENAQIQVTLSEEVKAARQGQAFCYYGSAGSPGRCEVVDDGQKVTATISNLSRRQGATMALGFESGTFAAYQKTLTEQLIEWWGLLQYLATALAVILLICLWSVWRYRVSRSKELATIVPEYLPPKEVSVLTSGYILRKYHQLSIKGSPMVAQLLDLAVRHYIKLYEVKKAGLLSSAQYEIEIVKDLKELRSEEREILKDMFDGQLPAVGERLNLKKLQNNQKYANRTRNDDDNLKQLIRGEYGLCSDNADNQRWIKAWQRRALVAMLLLVSPAMLALMIILYVLSREKTLTDKGLALRRYLAGLKMYIGVAEEERLRMLQSPEGVEKVQVNAHDEAQLVKLYERVLPYAVLFGQEKEWSKTLGKYYEQVGQQPDWYAGQGAFNAAMFASGMSGLSSAASRASNYSSSTGGSAGGGSAGGGGGGGGGGGW